MKNDLKIVFLFTAMFLLSSVCLEAAEPLAKKVSLAEDFKLIDLNKRTFSLSDYKGKQPLMLFFWTTWCPFCRKELKVLSDNYDNLKKDGIEILAIDVGEPDSKVDSFLKNQALAFTVLLDKDSIAARAYEVLGVPTYVLINKRGEIVQQDNRFPENYKDLVSK